MTLNERIDSDARLKGRRIRFKHRAPGVELLLAGQPLGSVGVDAFEDESPRFVKTSGSKASPSAVEFVVRQTDQDEHRLSQTDVH